MPDVSHGDILYVLTALIFGAYGYMWHSFNKLWEQREKDIKSVTDAMQGYSGRIDRIVELLVEIGGGTRKVDK